MATFLRKTNLLPTQFDDSIEPLPYSPTVEVYPEWPLSLVGHLVAHA